MPVFKIMTTDGDREFDRFNSPGIIYTQNQNTNIACSGSSSGGGGSDTLADPLSNTADGNLRVVDLETSDTFSLNDDLERIRNITSATEAPEVTTMTGSLVIPNIKSAGGNCQVDINDTDIQVVSTNGDIQLVANDINLDATNVLVNGNPIAIGGSNTELELQAKTQNISATSGSTTIAGHLLVSSSTTYDSSFLLALGQGSSHSIAYSTDGGDTWTGLPRDVLTFEANAATYGNGKWVAFGGSSPASIAYSSDGINWTAAGYPFTRGYGVHFANGLFVGLGNTTLTNNSIVTSTDGITWTGRGANIFTSYGVCVHYHDGIWVAGGVGTNSLAYSLDGTNWTGLGNSLFAQCRDVTYADGKWVAVGAGGANRLVTSPDGINWTGQGSIVFSSFKSIAFNGTLWVGVGSSGSSNSSIAYSSDLVNWTPVTDSYNTMYVGESVIWTGSKWIATGLHPSSAGSILTSPDGINWTETSVGLFNTGNGFGMKTPDTSSSSVTIADGGIHTTGDLVVGAIDEQTTYTVHNGNQYGDGTSNNSYGFSFDVSEPITVTHLMISTNHWDGSGGSTEMKFWTGVNGSGGSTSYNVLSSNIVGDYYELEVSIPLAVGTTYTLSGIPPNSYGGSNITPDPVIQNYNARYVAFGTGTGAIYPGSTFGGQTNYLWGAFGNFKFTKGPPPQRKDVYCGNVYANNIIPSTHDAHSLGTDTNRWNEIHAKTGYFAQQTIYLGDKWKLSVDETHPTTSSIKLSHASQGHDSGVIDNEVVLANPTHTGMVVNHTNLSGDTAKTSNTVSGIVEDYTAKVSILEGQPVSLDIDSDIKVTTITSSTPAWQIVGVATNACNAGDIVEVCTKGFCNVRRVTTYESPTLKLLNSSTNNTTPVGLAWTFKDSGNDSNYSSNENYKITFDAQEGGTWTLTFNSFTFEHAASSMYDRLGIQTSSDGTTFTNVSIPWMQKSASSSPPWSSSFAGSQWNSTSSKNGYIVPENTTRAILLGWDQQPVNINARYIRFTFFSDSSSNDPGWNITLVSSNYGAGNATVLPYGSPLYLDTSGSGDYTTVSTTGANIIAYSASADSSNDSIYSYIP